MLFATLYTPALFVSAYSTAGSNSRRTIKTLLCSSDENKTEPSVDNEAPKPKSRLALLAEDWLEEEEEEDELQSYWGRFDDKQTRHPTKESETAAAPIDNNEEETIVPPTTEQRLERYYAKRGIDKAKETERSERIQNAVAAARRAKTPEAAIAALENVRPYLRANTRSGGTALYELAVATWQRDGAPDEALLRESGGDGSYVRARIRRLVEDGEPPARRGGDSFWGVLTDGNRWWD